MARALWLADVLRAAGLRVVEMAGWEARQSRAGYDPQGIVWHHTATGPNWSNAKVRALLRDGRSDLGGPLCQLGLERDGTFVVVAAGRANHAGFGDPWGNDSIGIEAYNNGTGEPWPAVQVEAYDRGTAAICAHLGWDPMRKVRAHREVDPDRKIDPAGLDMDERRAAVAAVLEDDDMALNADDKKWISDQLGIVAGARSAQDAADGKVRSEVWRWSRESVILARQIAKQDPTVDIDEAAIAALVLEGLDPAAIAEVIPEGIAKQVADEIAARLSN